MFKPACSSLTEVSAMTAPMTCAPCDSLWLWPVAGWTGHQASCRQQNVHELLHSFTSFNPVPTPITSLCSATIEARMLAEYNTSSRRQPRSRGKLAWKSPSWLLMLQLEILAGRWSSPKDAKNSVCRCWQKNQGDFQVSAGDQYRDR